MTAERQPIYLYNTLTRKKERFEPRREDEVSIYVCGVTPYDEAHVGHARPSVFFDVVRRYLEALGYKVTLIQNFTDVDDKIIERAKLQGVEPLELARRFAESYLASMDQLGVRRATAYPKVSEHIDEIQSMVDGLIDKGAAYESSGSVYYSVDAFAEYGKLSNQRKEELMAGARIEAGEEKRSPLDFALWKAAKEGEPAWNSPWGAGRPGWHIECSAMALKYLGNGFDIHGGGVDLVFPHHENEIAQSEAYTEEPFARYWMHNGLVNFGAEKMSKSLGNFVTVDDALKTYEPALLRFAILQHHYRSPMEFSAEQMQSMKRGWRRLNKAIGELASYGEPIGVDEAEAQGAESGIVALAREAEGKFMQALADDFNTPAAIAVLFELVRDARAYVEPNAADEPRTMGLRAIYGVFQRLAGDMLGIVSDSNNEAPAASDQLVSGLMDLILQVRENARKARDYALADAVRDRLLELGIALEDTAEGTRWTLKE